METKKSEIEHQYENSLFSAYLTGQQSVRDKLDGRKPRDFTSWYKEGGHNFANSRINQQTTSQQQTIERLRNLLQKSSKILERHYQILDLEESEVADEIEQLLNTTEPSQNG